MPELPKRSAPYIIILLLAVLLAITLWIHMAVNSPEVRQAVREKKAAPALRRD
ncbi:MAG TPA: hypothetical protein PK490_04150 [Prosthecobacter sp.]|nr:hypothetical protein [Prosthecobacter sp.]HRK13454.1 hypothetical protein [Prosthecobacter sp.]